MYPSTAMLQARFEVFDEVITNANTWYTSDEFAEFLGAADLFTVQATAMLVSSPAPSISVSYEYSADGRSFTTYGTVIPSVSVSDNGSYSGAMQASPNLAFGRLAIALTGTTPQCRIRLIVTARSS